MDCISTLTLNVQIQVFLLYKVFCISFIFIEPSLKWWQGIISFKHPCVCSFMLNANWIVETSKMYSPRLTGPNLMILAPAGRKIPSKICSLTRAYVSNGLSGTGVLKPKAPRCPSCCGELCNSSTRATSAAAIAAADVALAAMDAFLGSQPMMTMAIMMMTLWLKLELELGL